MSEARQHSGSGIRDSGLGSTASNRATPDDLDAAIDAVACEMTQFEPSPALRARVLERLEQAPRRFPLAVSRWAWAGAAAVLVLAAATAVWLARPLQSPGKAEQVVAEEHASRPGVPAASQPQKPAGLGEGPTAQPVLAKRAASPAAPAVTQPEVREADEESSFVTPLSEIEPLRFAAVEPDPLHVAAVEIAPLTAAPAIDIPSLTQSPNDMPSADQKKEK